MNNKDEILKHLASLTAGPLTDDDANTVISYIAGHWDSFDGNANQTKMAPHKVGRAEHVEFTPPSTIAFNAERHGGLCLGSKYAEIEGWTVDLLNNTAYGGAVGRRLLEPRDKPLKVRPLAEQVVNAVVARDEASPLIKWRSANDLRVQIGTIIPTTYKQTTAARRKRFRTALREMLAPLGWSEVSYNRYLRTQPTRTDGSEAGVQ